MKLSIENFGPIKEGKIETKKVTVLIGNQGSGKSTVAKLLSTFCWIEKYMYRHDYSPKITDDIRSNIVNLLEYHRIENYLKNTTRIDFVGAVSRINMVSNRVEIESINGKYSLPKITYFPAERSFLSSIRKSKEGQEFNLWTKSLQEFKEIFQDAKDNLKGNLQLPINGIEVEYDRFNEVLYIKGKDYKIPLPESASGFQSFVPMYVVADYLSQMLRSEYEMSGEERAMFKKQSDEILNNTVFTDEQKRMLLSNLAKKINVKRMINVIEEPEQNLFPSSQRCMLNSLLGFNNEVSDNRLIITTHSPYILSYLMLAIKAA
ncbi:MAG: ATP-binding protein, partial [Bacteroidales bacterium]|nr:ATP-binding protein [Bacteroidales bacterium]